MEMTAAVEKAIFDKISSFGIATFKSSSLREVQEQDLNVLFCQLLTIYDGSWVVDVKNVKPPLVRKCFMRYFRLLDMQHIVSSVESMKPHSASVGQVLSCLLQKVEDKYGNQLQQRVRQVVKTSITLQPKMVQNSPLKNVPQSFPVTPDSKIVKLLDGKPMTPGSELKGREIPRSPPLGAAGRLTPFTSGPHQSEKTEEGQGWSPRKSSPRNRRGYVSEETPRVVAEDLTSQNAIPTGKQLGRTPPRSQEPGLEQRRMPDVPEAVEERIAHERAAQERVAHGGEYDAHENDKSRANNQGKLLMVSEVKATSQDKGSMLEEEHLHNQENVETNRHEKSGCSAPLTHTANSSTVFPAVRRESTPVALACPENLQCTQNDLQFLQLQENIHKLRGIEKEILHLTKQAGLLAHQKDLLHAEYNEVEGNFVQIDEKIAEAAQEVRAALEDQTPQSPSSLSTPAKEQLLARLAQKMAARTARLERVLQQEQQRQAESSLDSTTLLREERDNLLEEVQHNLPESIQSLQEQLSQLQSKVEQLKASKTSRSSDCPGGRRGGPSRTKRRLLILQERVQLLKRRRRVMKQMGRRSSPSGS